MLYGYPIAATAENWLHDRCALCWRRFIAVSTQSRSPPGLAGYNSRKLP